MPELLLDLLIQMVPQFYGYGKMSNANNTIVDHDSVFAIGSNTKVFTAILLADMVEDGLIKLRSDSKISSTEYYGTSIQWT